jgi:GH15 family glucan-1,4-alpha-glucosidase
MEQPAIENYALLGDTRTAALVSSAGAIDWMCAPRFDGEPLFGRLIGGPDAGTFRMGPAQHDAPVVTRRYRASSATVETTWAIDGARLTLTEGMVADVAGALLPTTMLVRRLEAEGGAVDVEIELTPRLGEKREAPQTSTRAGSTVCTWGHLAIAITSDGAAPVRVDATTSLRIDPGQPVTVVLAVADREPLVIVNPDAGWAALQTDERGWRAWVDQLDNPLPGQDIVIRSLITLRLLTYSPSGAPIAAPTTSLPEELGGGRNWDYRFAWPRDASIGVDAFLGVGNVDEARRFLFWLLHASRLARPKLPVLLTLHGRPSGSERELEQWPGYAGSRPVRIGNAASGQVQHDIYGWVIDAAWELTAANHRLYAETWRAMRGFADHVAATWRQPDAGIWEERGPGRHHVHSKVMAWLALDRALRIASTRRTPARQVERWKRERDAIATDVRVNGFSAEAGAYSREYGSSELDAALLRLPLIGLEPPHAPKVIATVDAIRSRLSAGGPLLYRYDRGQDGLEGTEGAFLPCSFWLVQALAATGRPDEANEVFAELAALANPVGLLAEEIDPTSGRHLGNFPQALSHASLVQAALAIGERRDLPIAETG